MIKIWDHTFEKKLKLDPSEHNILMTTIPNYPDYKKEAVTEQMFEYF